MKTKTQWQDGKVLWFDSFYNEGLVIDLKGNGYYVHGSALTTPVTDGAKIRFTVYENAYSKQIERVKLAD